MFRGIAERFHHHLACDLGGHRMWRAANKFFSETGVRALAVAFITAFIVMFLYALKNNNLTFIGDAQENWLVAKSLADPSFHYHSYVEYHGFVLFAICGLIYRLSILLGADAVLTLRFFGAVLFALLSAVSLPTLLGRLSGVTPTFGRRLLCITLVFFFFRGYFLYPSSDPLALFLLVLSLNYLTGTAPLGIGRSVMAGLWFGLAIYARSNYIIAAPLVLWLAVIRNGAPLTETHWKAAGRGLTLVLAVACMVIVNAKFTDYRASEYGDVTPSSTSKPSSARTNYKLNLVVAELTWGLRNQRVIWNAGDYRYPGALQFSENRGKAILRKEGLEKTDWIGLNQYASIAIRHPIDFALIYVRHAFDGLDASYPTIYVQDAGRRSVFFSLLNYFLIFSSLYALYENRHLLRSQWAILLALALPALSCAPFLIEPRFFMPLSIALLTYPIFANPWSRYFREPKVGPVLFAIAFVAGCFTISAHVFYSSLQKIPPTHPQLPFHTLL